MQAIVHIRSNVKVSRDVEDTLDMLNIDAVNHATFVPETEAYRGMITKVNDVVAHGQPSEETVATLLRTRGEPLDGEGDVTDEWVAEHTGYDDVDALAAALVDEETTLQDAGVAPTLRLHPPRGGHDGIKHPTKEGGQLGKHPTDKIDDLLEAMR